MIPIIKNIKKAILQAENPIGHIRMETTDVNPATYLGFGTWVLWGSGKVPVGVDSSDTDFSTVEKTGGTKEHRHEFRIAQRYNYGAPVGDGWDGCGAYKYSTGSYAGNSGQIPTTMANKNSALQNAMSEANFAGKYSTGDTQVASNFQPYITCYMWKRIA